MESHGASDAVFLGLVWLGALTTLALALSMLTVLLVLRLVHHLQARRRKRVRERWRPIILDSLYGLPKDLPRLSRADLVPFLEIWNHIHDAISGPAAERLNLLARKLRVDYAVLPLLRQRKFRRRLLAVVTCGHLREFSAWDDLHALLGHPNPVLSLAAARALMSIDPRQALHPFLRRVVQREDWPAGRVAAILAQADPRLVAPPLVRIVVDAGPELAMRLLRYLGLVDGPETQKAIARILQRSDDERLIAIALQELRDRRLIHHVHRFATHPSAFVRVQVANAIRRLGTVRDLPLLVRLLSDREWWVRYRAAQAIVHLVPRSEWGRIRRRLQDPYARDMLDQAIAEQTLQVAA